MIRWILGELGYWRAVLVEKSYLIRPYDQAADRRRWVWQRRTPCGRQVLAAMRPEQRAALERAVSAALDRRDVTGRGGST